MRLADVSMNDVHLPEHYSPIQPQHFCENEDQDHSNKDPRLLHVCTYALAN